jgi:hypothetical protein
VRMQVGRAVAAAVVVGAVISGCGGPPQAGTAVFIGDQAVALESVQSRLDAALARTDEYTQLTAQGGTAADLARIFVTRQVMHELLAREAAEQGIVITEAQVDEQLAQRGQASANGSLGVDSFLEGPALREWARDRAIATELGRSRISGLQVTVDLVGATSAEDARTKAQVLAAGGPEADALTSNPQTGRSGITVQAASSPGDAASPAFGLPVGGVAAYPPDPQQSGWLVLRVTDRRTDAPTDPAALSSLSQSQLVAIGERTLQPTAQEIGVRVNPRYGVWDPIQLRVVGEDQQAGLVLPPAVD